MFGYNLFKPHRGLFDLRIKHLTGTKPLPAGAGGICDVLFQVLKYDVLCDGSIGR